MSKRPHSSLLCLAAALWAITPFSQAARPNVLFIAVDDLRPELACYGETWIKSPHIDRLASRGMIFERAYCQQAICMASRASLMSGYRPDVGKIHDNGPLFEAVPDALTLNQHFLDNGYETLCMGKIYHHASDYKPGWSKPAFKPAGDWVGRGYLDEDSARIATEYDRSHPNEKRQGMGPAYEAPDVADDAYPDGLIAAHAVAELQRLAKLPPGERKPFFMAVGFMKPHLPFNAPKKYWDLYDPARIELAEHRSVPKGAPRPALTGWNELRGYHGMPKSGPMPDEEARRLIHGYAACVSYTDAMIGRVLGELKRLGMEDNTVVVLWGDHGWKLGDLGMWCKHTNYELDTRVPLIVSAPGMKAPGGRTRALTEFVDIYPTLCELAGLELPGHLQGTSFKPLLDDPGKSWKRAAFSMFPRGKVLGWSMRTDRHRYTEWRDSKTGKVRERELYDHSQDPHELNNLAPDKEMADLIQQLSAQLTAGHLEARPR